MRRALFLTSLLSLLTGLPLGAQSRIPMYGPVFPGNNFRYPPYPVFYPPSPFVQRRVIAPRRVFVPVPVPVYFGPLYGNYGAEPSPSQVYLQTPQVSEASTRDVEDELHALRDEIHGLREDRLRDEIDQLRTERLRAELRAERRNPPAEEEEVPRPRAKPRVPSGAEDEVHGGGPTVTLVLRDGRRLEVSNYAVVGQTLWDFTADRAKRIPLSWLDLPATIKLNQEQGVEISLPSEPKTP